MKLSLSNRNMKKLITISNKQKKYDIIKNIKNIGVIISNYNAVKDIEKIVEILIIIIFISRKKGMIINIGNNTLRVQFNNESYLNEFI